MVKIKGTSTCIPFSNLVILAFIIKHYLNNKC